MRFERYRVAAVCLAALSLSACSYKKFAEQEQAIQGEWAQVQTALQRRNDLIPALIETVRRFVPDDGSVYQTLADGRTRLAAARTASEKIETANQQSMALERLMAIVDGHPEVRASESFGPLMGQLAAVQNSIAVERMRYNAQVQQYNVSRRQFPGMLTALALFHSYPFFEVPAPGRDASKTELKGQPQP